MTTDSHRNEKLAYEAPRLVVHGTFEDITQGKADGARLDATFPVGTPKGDITFS